FGLLSSAEQARLIDCDRAKMQSILTFFSTKVHSRERIQPHASGMRPIHLEAPTLLTAMDTKMTTDTKQHSLLQQALSEHPAFLLTSLYFVASSIGLVYSWAFLRGFDINILHYAEISDFLLASLKEPLTWLLTLMGCLSVILDNAMSRRVAQKSRGRFFRWYASKRYRQVNYIAAVIAIIIFLLAYAQRAEREVRDGAGDLVTVHLTDGSPPKRLIILATTVKFIIFYEHATQRVDIHPNESILMLSFTSPEAPEANQPAKKTEPKITP
ncbi:MAG: hypothetical protein ACI9TP_002097, partial [Candidatus Azotimanducaceae bacterium]